jgi:hypothetical protein
VVLSVVDATSGSANGTVWFDNMQLRDETTTGATRCRTVSCASCSLRRSWWCRGSSATCPRRRSSAGARIWRAGPKAAHSTTPSVGPTRSRRVRCWRLRRWATMGRSPRRRPPWCWTPGATGATTSMPRSGRAGGVPACSARRPRTRWAPFI